MQRKEIKIKRIIKKQKTSQKGNKYYWMGIIDTDDKMYNTIYADYTKEFAVGDKVTLDFETTFSTKDNKEYYNVVLPPQGTPSPKKEESKKIWEEILQTLREIRELLKPKDQQQKTFAEVADEVNDSLEPFQY